MSFDLKKYLAEGKLLKEDTGVDMILSPDQIKRYASKAGNLPLVKDYISIFTQMADDERDEELA